MADLAVRVRGAGFSYNGKQPVFANLNCDIRYAEIFAILGPNGQGKTTFLKSVLRALHLTQGTIEHDEIIGFVPQSFAPAFSYSVFDIVLMGRAMHLPVLKSPSRMDRDKAREALATLDMESLADREFNRLSGGQKQLVLIARAIAMECRVLLLDEPTSALDLGNQQRVLGLMARLAKDDGIAVVFTTHQPVHALNLADQVMLMSPQQEAVVGPANEVVTSERLSQAYGTPLQVKDVDHEGRIYKTVIPLAGLANLQSR